MPDSSTPSTGRLFSMLYDELHQLASARLSNECSFASLNATGLVHEVFLRLAGEKRDKRFENSKHLFSTAAEAMRWILIDRARARKRLKRQAPEHQPDEIDEWSIGIATDDQLIAVNDSLTRLEKEDPDSAELVKLRFFAGFTIKEIANQLGVSESKIKRQWAYAKAWLKADLKESEQS